MASIGDKITGRCFKCGENKEFAIEQIKSGKDEGSNFKNKNTTIAMGVCPTCNKKISRIVSSKKKE